MPLKISQTVTIKEIKNTIWKLPIRKAVGLDRILNKTIKAVLKALTIPLANIATTCLLKDKLPECYKTTTTIVLQKANKKDYSLLRSYQSITFKNTLGKLLEKIIAKHMQETAKIQNLLLWTQIGAKKKQSTLSAISLITSSI